MKRKKIIIIIAILIVIIIPSIFIIKNCANNNNNGNVKVDKWGFTCTQVSRNKRTGLFDSGYDLDAKITIYNNDNKGKYIYANSFTIVAYYYAEASTSCKNYTFNGSSSIYIEANEYKTVSLNCYLSKDKLPDGIKLMYIDKTIEEFSTYNF